MAFRKNDPDRPRRDAGNDFERTFRPPLPESERVAVANSNQSKSASVPHLSPVSQRRPYWATDGGNGFRSVNWR